LIAIHCGRLVLAETPISVCELLERRVELNGRLVTVRGEVRSGPHGGWLTASSDCRYQLASKASPWPNYIWIMFPLNQTPYEEFHASFKVDFKSVRRAENKVRKLGFNDETDQLIETYVGRFVTYPDLESRVNPPSLGGSKLGFGPVGLDAPAQLIIKSVADVEVLRVKR
jgi:hypothetical protein